MVSARLEISTGSSEMDEKNFLRKSGGKKRGKGLKSRHYRSKEKYE